MNLPAMQRRISDSVLEYEEKMKRLPEEIKQFEKAGEVIRIASVVGGTFGNVSLDVGRIYEHNLKSSLLGSAWQNVYNHMQIGRIASAADKRKFEQSMANPIPFTMDNIRATFGDYILDPRGNILRGLAEVFGSLDQAYKSHEKVKIGVKGLPKRVILTSVGSYSSWGRDKLENLLNALASYQGKPLISYSELESILKTEDSLLADRGVSLRRFNNGNGHVFFEPDTLRDINLALAEYYGDILPDTDDKPTKKTESTAVSKDLQYYPTPTAVIETVLYNISIKEGEKILEPSCGCGRFLDALRDQGADVFGIEFDAVRANQCRDKGHKVLTRNFLETAPTGDYDKVVMNPPFYGKHYAKHIEHALKFLKTGGILTAILPITARYDHKLVDGMWSDLPTGSFRDSGTNINTTILTIRN